MGRRSGKGMAAILRPGAPGGESLHDTLARVIPYYLTMILPLVLRGEKTIVVAHGNSLRALIMALESISRDRIAALEIPTGTAFYYQVNADGTVKQKASFRPDY